VRHFNRAVAALLMADGASFVAASSQDPAAKGAALTTMQDNLLTNKPTAWLQNGDKRYIFGPGDTNQWIEISLGRIDEVSLIGAKVSLPYSDRWVVGPLMVEVSTNGTSWTEFGQPLVLSKTSKNPIINMAGRASRNFTPMAPRCRSRQLGQRWWSVSGSSGPRSVRAVTGSRSARNRYPCDNVWKRRAGRGRSVRLRNTSVSPLLKTIGM
jgi:hypothetical protein